MEQYKKVYNWWLTLKIWESILRRNGWRKLSNFMEFIWNKSSGEPSHHVMPITVITLIVCPIKGGKEEDE